LDYLYLYKYKPNLLLSNPPISPPPPSYAAAPASPVIPQSLRPAERPRERRNSIIREQQSLSYFQQHPSFLAPIKEASSSSAQSSLSSTIDLNRSPAIRRSSNPESFFSSLYRDTGILSPPAAAEPSHANTVISTPLPSSHFDLPIPDLSRAFESEDDDDDEEDIYMENTTTTIQNGQQQHHGLGHPTTADSAASFAASFYYNYSPPVQRRQQQQQHQPPLPPKLVPLRPTGVSAFYAAPVRGAGYYSTIRTDDTR
jgi:hypothetical protein